MPVYPPTHTIPAGARPALRDPAGNQFGRPAAGGGDSMTTGPGGKDRRNAGARVVYDLLERRFKDQVLASAEWPDEACFEGLMCDVDGNLVEGTRSNLFVRRADRLLTPGLERAGVAGIVRAAVLAAAPALGLRCEIRTLAPAELAAADELFVTNSIIGIRSLARVRGHADWVFTARDCAEQLAAHLRGQGVVA